MLKLLKHCQLSNKESEYDWEIPQSQVSDQPKMQLQETQNRHLQNSKSTIGPRHEKTGLRGLRTTKAQTSLRILRLISAFVIRFLGSIISKFDTSEISIF